MSEQTVRLPLADHLALLRVLSAAVRMGCRLLRVEAEFGTLPATVLVIEGPEASRRRLAAYAERVVNVYEEKS